MFSRSAGFRYDSLGSTRAAKNKNARGLQRIMATVGKREVEKPGIECIQKLSDHAVDWFLVSPGLTLRGSRSSHESRTGGFYYYYYYFL